MLRTDQPSNFSFLSSSSSVASRSHRCAEHARLDPQRMRTARRTMIEAGSLQ
jgi:hypothetical protein